MLFFKTVVAYSNSPQPWRMKAFWNLPVLLWRHLPKWCLSTRGRKKHLARLTKLMTAPTYIIIFIFFISIFYRWLWSNYITFVQKYCHQIFSWKTSCQNTWNHHWNFEKYFGICWSYSKYEKWNGSCCIVKGIQEISRFSSIKKIPTER